MDGLFQGKPYEQMDDLGVKTPIFGSTHVSNFEIHFGLSSSKIPKPTLSSV